MEDHFGFCKSDCASILAHLKVQEKHLILKRRWLLGLPLSRSQQEELFKDKSLPESLLREDDIFCESVKVYVGDTFAARAFARKDHTNEETKQLSDRTNMKRIIFSCLNTLTTKGLYLLAVFLTRGSVKFEKTRKKLKMVIRESLPRVLRDQIHDYGHMEISSILSQLLNNPRYLRENCFLTVQSDKIAAVNILEGLEDLPSETLHAMRRKLRGVPASIPHIKQTKHKWSREKLIRKVRRASKNFLSELGRGDELQTPLAKALALASLSLKLTEGWSTFTLTDFNQFSPKTKIMQNEIAKAIWLLKTKVRFPEVKTLQCLLDPNANISNGKLRTAIKKLLTEYLFEISDLDVIPECLSEALAIINRSSRSMPRLCFLKEEIEEEVECILHVSAQTRQVVWDLLPVNELDEDYTDAYMEELGESDDDDLDHDNYADVSVATDLDHVDQQLKLRNSPSTMSSSFDWNDWEEGSGENLPVEVETPICNGGTFGFSSCQEARILNGTSNREVNHSVGVSQGQHETLATNGNGMFMLHSRDERSNGKDIHINVTGQHGMIDPGNLHDLPPRNSCKSTHQNIYLSIQDVCDDMSMISHNLIGYIMDGLAEEEKLNLDSHGTSYLRGDYFAQKNAETKEFSSKRNVDVTAFLRVVEEQLPKFSKREKEKLKQLMNMDDI
ncbi:hypothetical protein K2173_017227 [Erythroxylum novogranatense]|uniref:Uncharacterized protein n=1 Tax=Erythroxylum novogranatense TaxID=1862640 RepID=A0AAV8U7A6_9ROSI|nr:hypothetical protein K2173_017227 [Erythroxylum novogranatense]